MLLIYTLGGLLPWRWCCLAPPALLLVQVLFEQHFALLDNSARTPFFLFVLQVLGLATVVESPAWLLAHRFGYFSNQVYALFVLYANK